MLPLACTNKSTRNDKQFKCHMHGLNRTFFSKNTLCKSTQNLLWFLLNLHQHFCNFCGHICHCVVYISAYPALKCKQLWQHGIMSYTYLLFSGTAFHVFWVIMEMLWICIDFHSGLQFHLQKCAPLNWETYSQSTKHELSLLKEANYENQDGLSTYFKNADL